MILDAGFQPALDLRIRHPGLDPGSRSSLPCAWSQAARPRIKSGVTKMGRTAKNRWWTFTSRRSEEHTSELQSLMRISYAVFCLKKKIHIINKYTQESVRKKQE